MNLSDDPLMVDAINKLHVACNRTFPDRLLAFFNKIVHGEADHRLWLKDEIEKFWCVDFKLKVCTACGGRGDVAESFNNIPNAYSFVDCKACKKTGFVPMENTNGKVPESEGTPRP